MTHTVENSQLQEPLKEVTVEFVRSLKPCYSRERLEKLANGRASLTLIEVCDLDVPAKDLLWFLLRPEVLPEKMLHSLACDFAEHALLRAREAGREPDASSWVAIEVKRRWLRGDATNEELTEAQHAAYAAYVAATYVAAAYFAADYVAADYVANVVAAAYAADAERAWQLSRVRAFLLGTEQ